MGVRSHCPLGKADAGARHRAARSSVTAQCPTSQKKCQTHAPHESVHVPLTDCTPHRLRTRMCNRSSHPHGFTHSLTHSLAHSLTHTERVVEQSATPSAVSSHTRVSVAVCAFAVAPRRPHLRGVFFPCVLRPSVATVTVASTTVRPRPSSQVTRGPTALRGLSSATPSLLQAAWVHLDRTAWLRL